MTATLRQRMEDDVKTAMKSGDTGSRDTIRFFLAAVKNAEIDKRDALTEEEGVTLLHRQAKRLAESIEQFRAGGRDDLAEKEIAQLAILRRYLPEEMTDDDLADLARVVVAETGATTAKDLGRVMPILIERVAGRADGKRISSAARAALTGAA
jgi:uncharacterized protein YqeY